MSGWGVYDVIIEIILNIFHMYSAYFPQNKSRFVV